MKRYAKLQRRIRAEQEDFLDDVIIAAGFKPCAVLVSPPEGRSVYVEWDDGNRFVLTPCFSVPVYMSVNKSSPTYKERSAQEKEATVKGLVDCLLVEGLKSEVENQFTDDVAIHVQV